MTEPAESAASATAEAQPQSTPFVGQADPALWSNGILAALSPGIAAADAQISGVFASQSQLAMQIDRLTAAMASFQSISKTPHALAPYTAKLVSSRKRVKKLTADIGKVQGRLDEIRALVRKKEGISSAAPKAASSSAAAAPASTGLFDKISSSLKSSKDSSPSLSRVTSIGTSGAPAATAASSANAAAPAPATAPSGDVASTNATAAPSTAASAAAADSTAAPFAAASPSDSAVTGAADSTAAAPSTSSSLAPVPEGSTATATAASAGPPSDLSARAKVSALLAWE